MFMIKYQIKYLRLNGGDLIFKKRAILKHVSTVSSRFFVFKKLFFEPNSIN